MNAVPPELESLLRRTLEAFHGGQWDRAASLAAEVLSRWPANYDAEHVQALSLLNAGRATDALPLAEVLVTRYRDDPWAHNTHGAVLQVLGRLEEAATAYRKSVSLAPQNSIGWFNLARVESALGRHDGAVSCCRSAIRAGGENPQVQALLASSLLAAGRAEEALEPARLAAQSAPQWAPAIEAAARAELEAGSLSASVERFRSLESLAPPPDRWRFARSLAWPAIIESREEIERRREEVERSLDDLIAEPARLADPFAEVGLTGFHLAYQGFDDTQIQRKIAQAYRLAAPSLEWTAPHVATQRDRGRRIRLGILSRHLGNHTIGKLNIGIAQKLDRKRFELVVLRPAAQADFLSRSFDECASRVITLPLDLASARRMVADARLDALFYPDIGMDPFTYLLAFARLARVQFTTWGHPVTTGIPNMDYFISTRHAEPEGGQRFYSEKLVELENAPSYYYRPRDPSGFDVRRQLGLGAQDRLYACLQTLYKMHPDFDRALVEVLRRDPGGRILLIAAPQSTWNERLRRRLAREGPDVADRIVFMPAVSLPDYLAALRDADALLDTFHFGGGNSSYESFGISSPVVTLPGERMRGRVTAALYAQMGQSRWIARSAEHFVALALQLAHERGMRAEWRREIAEGAGRFLENDAVVREYEDFVERVLS